MNILYGLAGEGFGHSSRARTVIPYLESKGHRVKVMTYGQALEVLKKEGFDVFEIKGMHIHFENGKLNPIATLKRGLQSFLQNTGKSKEIYELMKEKFDLCISDMEPLVPMLSNWYNLPLLSLDNQHRLTNLELDIPKKYYNDYLAAKTVTNLFISRGDWYIIVSFTKGKIKNNCKKNTYVVHPIIQDEIKNLSPKKCDSILVYLSKKDKAILRVLRQINEKFIIYGYRVEKKEKNLVFHKAGEGFLKDLGKCKAIIGTAGFNLISEALYLKKPYLALPLKGHFEQMLNALCLKNSGFGEYSENLEKEEIKRFLENLEKYEEKLKKYNPNYDLLFKSLDKVLDKVEKKSKGK